MITCGEYAEFLRVSAARVPEILGEVTSAVVISAAERARGYIGNDQDGWDPLSGATLMGFRHWRGMWIPGKIEEGYSPPENPLLRTGNLRDSIEAEVVEPTLGIIGSAEKTALWQELGTEGADYPIPPRPFLAKGMLETMPEAEALLEAAAVALLVPESL